MNQAILMNTYINECSKVRDVSDHSLKMHPNLKIFHVLDGFTELHFLVVISRVSSRLFQFLQNVIQGVAANFFRDKFLKLNFLKCVLITNQICNQKVLTGCHLLHHAVTLRMNCRLVQRVLSISNS